MALSITFYNNIKYSKDDFMNRDRDLFGNGVLQADHFPLTLPAEPGMTLTAGEGVAWVDGYRIANDAAPIALTVDPADAEPRIDIVQVGHDDELQVAVLKVKRGVPGAKPMEPGADPGFYKLYAIRVEPGVTAIYAEDILDRRTLVPLKVSGTQIQYSGAATVDANTFTGAQTAPSFIATDEAAPLQVPALDALPDAVGPEGTVCVVGKRWYISDGTQWNDMAPPMFAPPNLLDPTQMHFTRNTEAHKKNLQRTPVHSMRTEQGKFGQAAFIEEATTNLVYNSDFETVTGTGVMFSDTLASNEAWTIKTGAGSFGATGLVSTSNLFVTAGHPLWRPLRGSNNQNLELIAQATFVTGADISSGYVNVSLMASDGDLANRYYAEIFLGGGMFYIAKSFNGTLTTIANSNPNTFSVSPNSTYTIVLSFNVNNLLTAKLYSGAGDGGTLLGTASVTDTTFPASSTNFKLGLYMTNGNRATSCSVTAPKPDGWMVRGDSRVAWALTQDAISGSYSLSAKGIPGVPGRMVGTGISVQPTASYAVSSYIKATKSGNSGRGARVVLDFNSGSGSYLSNIAPQPVVTSAPTQCIAVSGLSHAESAIGVPYLLVEDEGTFVFDAVQVEQKAFATTYVRNDSTTSTATRSADALSYSLAEPLPKQHFAALVWRPERGSDEESGVWCDRTLLSTSDQNKTALPHLLHYVNRENPDWGLAAHTFRLGRVNTSGEGTALSSEPISYQAGDTIFAAYAEDAVNGHLTMWIGINGIPLKKYSAPCTGTADDHAISVGCRFDSTTSAFEANGTIDHLLLTDVIPTDEQVEALYQASDWSGVHHPSGLLPSTVSIGGDTALRRFASGGLQMLAPYGNGLVSSRMNAYLTSNGYSEEGAWKRFETNEGAATLFADRSGFAGIGVSNAGSNPINWNIYKLLMSLGGGHKMCTVRSIQQTTPAATGIQKIATIAFPASFASAPAVLLTVENNLGTAVKTLAASNISGTGFEIWADVTQGNQLFTFHYMAIGS